MNSQVVKETNYSAAFRRTLENEQNVGLKNLRENAFAFFAENGFPTPADEEWKYTNVAPIAKEAFEVGSERAAAGDVNINAFNYEVAGGELIFINGAFNEGLSSIAALPPSCVVETSLEKAAKNERFASAIQENFGQLVDYKLNGFTALNTALASVGAFIFIPQDTKIETPIHLVFGSDGEAPVAAFPRVFIFMERGSEATLIESYWRTAETKYFTNAVVEIVLADDAKLKHTRVQRESHQAFHVGATAARLGRASLYDSTNITLGGRISRHDVAVRFNGEGGEAFVDGLYLVSEQQHTDTHSVIDHAVPNCVSHQTYKGIVDEKARAVFNGKVFVRENARGTDAQQSNKNLLLSNEARVDTKPQLEIFNDDVKCSHGATVGQLEEEELFYLLSRGLNEILARNLLTYGFAEEVINKIEIQSIKNQLDEAVLNRLHANLEG